MNNEIKDSVDHPAHYNAGQIEVIDAIEDWQLGFHLGNVVKYVARAGHKGKELEDLQKARWYLDRKIQKLVRGAQKQAAAVRSPAFRCYQWGVGPCANCGRPYDEHWWGRRRAADPREVANCQNQDSIWRQTDAQ